MDHAQEEEVRAKCVKENQEAHCVHVPCCGCNSSNVSFFLCINLEFEEAHLRPSPQTLSSEFQGGKGRLSF